MKAVDERFIKYVKFDTQSEESDCFPSTEKQKVLLKELADELRKLGIDDVRMDERYGYVYASIPSNIEADVPAIGFISHVDTSPAVSGADVKPRYVKNYDGGDIHLGGEYVLTPRLSPELKNYIGKTLIVTDGTTLLGGDDKAGVAEIMAAAEYVMRNPEFKHGKICIGFTPDEEVGRGVDFFDIKAFGADFAYTVDGGAAGELEYENFNAASARLTVKGRSIHPGSAKNVMVNAILVAQEFQAMLPVHENPASTEGYEGFYHPDSINGNVDEVKADYIIRDHDMELFEKKKALFLKCAEFINQKYGEGTAIAEITDSYYNMREMVEKHMHLIKNAKTAYMECSVEPIIQPIRGGTDGARLSFMGLPCPNLGTGDHNCHGRYEYVCVESMKKMTEVIIRIIGIYAGK